MRMTSYWRFYLSLILLQIAVVISTSAQTARTLIRTGHLLDVKTGAEPAAQTIIITGDRITAIAPTASTPKQSGDTEIDLTKYTVMPGLIDVHTHLTFANNFDPYFELSMTPAKEGILGVENAKVTLEAGFTTVRNVGANDFADVALRDEINAGHIPGPHMQVSGPIIGITGGHADDNLLPYEFHVHSEGVVDGIPAVQHQVRENIKYGADLIKIAATGGVLSKGDNPGAPQFTFEELKAAAETAHMAGRKIAAHAHGTEGIKNSILAGIDSIEHASLIDDEGIRLAKEHGTYLVMDIYNDDYILNEAPKFGLPTENIEKEKMVGKLQRENFEKAVKAGVKMAFGTDAGVYPHGDNAKQFYYMVKFGMTPAQAIRAATSSAADLIGRASDVGTIEPGKYADIIAVQSDPLSDIRSLEHVDFVMKGGTVYKDPRSGSATRQ